MNRANFLPYREIHLDFHTSEQIAGIGADFDPDEFADTLVKAHVNSITCFARCHHGWIYYDTELNPERRHPHLSRNLLKLLPEAHVTAGGIEYGTHDVRSVLKAIRADNWLWTHGDPHSAQGREIRANLREMFYPALPEWKIMVLSRSNDVIRQALAGLAGA